MPFKNHSWLRTKTRLRGPTKSRQTDKVRIPAAVKNFGYTFPAKHITITLAPADTKKEDWAYDPPMAVGRTLEVVAVGGNTVKLVGPPWDRWKTMLAKRLPTILPDLTLSEALEIAKIRWSFSRPQWRGRPRWIHSPGEEFGVQCFCVSISHSFFFFQME